MGFKKYTFKYNVSMVQVLEVGWSESDFQNPIILELAKATERKVSVKKECLLWY